MEPAVPIRAMMQSWSIEVFRDEEFGKYQISR
jgi:hypothetical protein